MASWKSPVFAHRTTRAAMSARRLRGGTPGDITRPQPLPQLHYYICKWAKKQADKVNTKSVHQVWAP